MSDKLDGHVSSRYVHLVVAIAAVSARSALDGIHSQKSKLTRTTAAPLSYESARVSRDDATRLICQTNTHVGIAIQHNTTHSDSISNTIPARHRLPNHTLRPSSLPS
jgi:hypothetical protein